MAQKRPGVAPPVMPGDAPDWAQRYGEDAAAVIRALLTEIATLKDRLKTAGIA